MLCVKFGWNWPSGSRGEEETVIVDRQTERQCENVCQVYAQYELVCLKTVFYLLMYLLIPRTFVESLGRKIHT